MALVTLATLRTRVRQRSDNEHTGSSFVTDAELNGLISSSYAELYGHLVQAGMHHTETAQTVTVTGAATYSLNDFFSIIGVWRVDGSGRVRIPRHELRLRPSTAASGSPTSYRIVGTDLQLACGSALAGSGSVEVVYIPPAAALTTDSDTVEGVNGWEEWIVIDAAIDVLLKEQLPVGDLMAERQRMLDRISAEAVAQEMTASYCIPGPSPLDGEGPVDEGDYRGYRGYRGRFW